MILSLFLFPAEEWWFYWEEQSWSLSDWREAEDMLLLEEGHVCWLCVVVLAIDS